ncbi:MAG: hypothetical protein R2682_15240 [Pyrinomonadaceae bacterium]
MKSVSPVIPGENFPEILIAENQDEYQNLPAIRAYPGVVITRWQPTVWERLRLLFGGSIYLWIWQFDKPLQPVLLDVNKPRFEETQNASQA